MYEYNNTTNSFCNPINTTTSFYNIISPSMDNNIDPYNPCSSNSFLNFPISPHSMPYEEYIYLQYLMDETAQQNPNSSTNTSFIEEQEVERKDNNDPQNPTKENTTSDMQKSSVGKTAATSVMRKNRCSRRDRHSKIDTAQGLRDRRMRLSLDVARRFFDLQDMLGFDKASATVDWLIGQAKAAIEELMMANNRSSSNFSASSNTTVSECEVVSSSELINNSNDDNVMPYTCFSTAEAEDKKRENKLKKKKVAQRRVLRTLGRESRKEARERAKARTSQKRWLLSNNSNSNSNINNNHDIGVFMRSSTCSVDDHQSRNIHSNSSIIMSSLGL